MFHLYSLFHFTPFFTVFIDFIDMESCVFCLATVVLISRTLRMKRQRVAWLWVLIRSFRSTAAFTLTSQRTLQTLRITTPHWRARMAFCHHVLNWRETDVEARAERERCLEAPRPAVAQVATFHTVPPTLRCLMCHSVLVRVLTTSAASPETLRSPSAVPREQAAHKPKVPLQGVTASSLLFPQVAFRASVPPRLSVSLIA